MHVCMHACIKPLLIVRTLADIGRWDRQSYLKMSQKRQLKYQSNTFENIETHLDAYSCLRFDAMRYEATNSLNVEINATK